MSLDFFEPINEIEYLVEGPEDCGGGRGDSRRLESSPGVDESFLARTCLRLSDLGGRCS